MSSMVVINSLYFQSFSHVLKETSDVISYDALVLSQV